MACDPESADNGLKLTSQSHFRLWEGLENNIGIHLDAWLADSSAFQRTAESLSQQLLPPLQPGALMSTGGADWKLSNHFSGLNPAGYSCSRELSMYVYSFYSLTFLLTMYMGLLYAPKFVTYGSWSLWSFSCVITSALVNIPSFLTLWHLTILLFCQFVVF